MRLWLCLAMLGACGEPFHAENCCDTPNGTDECRDNEVACTYEEPLSVACEQATAVKTVVGGTTCSDGRAALPTPICDERDPDRTFMLCVYGCDPTKARRFQDEAELAAFDLSSICKPST